MKKTKLICTIGTSCEDEETIKNMILNGMDVARINMSHASYDFAEDIVSKIRKINSELKTNVGILFDTKGPEIRVGVLKNGYTNLVNGDVVTLTPNIADGTNKRINISERKLSLSLDIDSLILMDDGNIELKVTDISNEEITCKVIQGGILKENKGINIPNNNVDMEFLSQEDKNDIIFACKLNVDFLALSFVRNANDILDVNDILISEKNEHMQIISKIECMSAVDDIEDIIKVSDGIMIARGDLGIEIELAKLPCIQKDIIKRVRNKGKICIVATEMLASMEGKQRPTRAEVSDVANAVIDGVDSVMLSGETAIGKYPVETVKTMYDIIIETEKNLDYHKILIDSYNNNNCDVTGVLAYSTVDAANMLNAKTIVVSTISGYTAKRVSAYRPECFIIATTPETNTATSLSLNWGVLPVLVEKYNSTDEIVEESIKIAKDHIGLSNGDKIIITGGFPIKGTRNTNFLKVEEIE